MSTKNWTYLAILAGVIVILYLQFLKKPPLYLSLIGTMLLFLGLARLMTSIKGEKPPKRWIEEDEEE